MITVPAYLYHDFHDVQVHPTIRRLEHLADAVIEIESFAGSPKPVNPQYTSDYHGLVHPHKLFKMNSLVHSSRLNNIQLHSLGFKVRRKRFSIETFHLPPELGDEGKTESASMACSTKPNNKLDF